MRIEVPKRGIGQRKESISLSYKCSFSTGRIGCGISWKRKKRSVTQGRGKLEYTTYLRDLIRVILLWWAEIMNRNVDQLVL